EARKSCGNITKRNDIGLCCLAHINPIYFSINPKKVVWAKSPIVFMVHHAFKTFLLVQST
ncbi:hypothetical protein VUS17_34600, partial [Pseudomonas aeruginosa]|uniref:hypothetical protein n=1 Tax=Pseudomonas aeruginosa TaxID=287 RepID=UPI003006D601